MALPHVGALPGANPGAPPAPVIGAVVPGPPKSYRELLSDESNSPAPDRIANYLHGYRFDGGGVPAPATLRDQTVTLSDRQPMTFLSLVQGPFGTPEVAIIHRLMRYMDMPGEEASGFHDRVLGLIGDIMPHQYPTVDVPNTAYHLVGTPVRVPTTEAMNALLPTWEDQNTPLGPYTEADPETEVVRPRHTQLVPGYYAALIIHRRGVSAKLAFQELYGAMQARGEVDRCQDIIVWLKAACTARGGGGLQNGVPIVYHPLAPVHLPGEVYRYMIGKVRADLPALAAPDAATTGITDTLAGALRALTGRVVDEGGERSSREPKTVKEVFKETYRTLLRFCNVAEETDVAPVWQRLANCTKSEQMTVMIQEFQKVCNSRGLATDTYTPIVTSALKQMILGFQFVGHGVDDLSTGCQPFMVSYAGNDNQLQALETAEVGNQLAQGEHSATLTDYRTLREKEKLKFPRDTLDVCITIGRYAVLCQTLFQGAGPPNPLVEVTWQLVAALQNATPYIVDRFAQVARVPAIANVYFASIVRAVQVHVHEYLHSVSVNVAEGHAGIDPPEFRTMVTELKRGTFQYSSNWVPLPEAYLEPVRGSPSGTGSSRTPSATPTGASSVSTTRTGVSSLTADSTRTPVARVDNPTPDADFSSITIRAGGTRPILRDHPPPANDAGQEFCVAWWLRSGCFPNCRRRATHTPFASAAERARLLSFCRDHIAAPAAGGTSS
jgi:hypothetical protein